MKMTCRKCKLEKQESDFYLRKQGGSLMTTCKTCISSSASARYAQANAKGREKNREYYASNRDKIATRKKERRSEKLENTLKYLLLNGKSGSKTRGRVFEISYDFIRALWDKQSGRCFYLDREMDLSGKYAVSIDRYDSSRGYTEDNVNLVCRAVNYMRRDLTHLDFVNLCKIIGEKI